MIKYEWGISICNRMMQLVIKYEGAINDKIWMGY